MYIGLNVTYPLFLPGFNKLEFSRQMFEKYLNIKFHENPYIGSRVFACGRIDRRTDMTKLRALAHTPAFCRSRIRLRSWSFSHVPALPLPAVGFIQTEVFKTVVWHRQIEIRAQGETQYIETDKPHKEDVCAASCLSSFSPARKFAGPATRPDRLRVKAPIY